MDRNNEQHLLEAIRSGDKEAFGTLVEPLIARAYRTSVAILKSPHLAEEAMQNALIESYTTITKGKEIRHFRGWFSRVIANRAMDLVRQENRHQNGLDIDGMELQDHSATPIEEIVKKEESNQLLEAVMSLELQQRVVVVLYYFQELKIEEIASVLNVREGTVKSRLYHSRLKLSQMVSIPQLNAKVVQL
ncbi:MULTISPECIES: RNA polymerase sigma factor [unclassified Paenibacillus]|uniref:RNA polymerase sigma factor n=1 Tax=unclassified Paenibacillus TaxID=185978 RepID=UPI001AEB61F2|nr:MULTISPECIES: RNA polymerase sigma factor [unclassified Paenibacillus]MBP1155658.1 RNA polymerase sigma-70 factor (ECF subfamily) [Paenibacillus sp. PvP091]MBP1168956.1 RNA polymerase sigma-70 factor (ECF subfamily) [Paenibacillus sp. PvR098]MBP2439984.1 RNA polymerase sigma-70 factor (ECF subfamily) [Paenibacillus sp. PvP052]